MRATSFMTSPVVTVGTDTTIKQAARILLDHDVGAAPVVDGQGRLVGMVAEPDLLRAELQPDPRAQLSRASPTEAAAPRTVADVMTPDVIALPESADESQFAALMLTHRVRSIPVTRGEVVVGIVARRDLLRTLARSDEMIAEDVTERLRDYTGGDHWMVEVRNGVVSLSPQENQSPVGVPRVVTLLACTVPGVLRVQLPEDLSAALDRG